MVMFYGNIIDLDCIPNVVERPKKRGTGTM